MMLPDPRQWPAPAMPSPLAALVGKSLNGDVAARATLRLELDALIEAGNDGAVREVLRDAGSPEGYRHVREIVARLVNKPDRGETVIARLFALPLVIVAGAKKALQTPDATRAIASRFNACCMRLPIKPGISRLTKTG